MRILWLLLIALLLCNGAISAEKDTVAIKKTGFVKALVQDSWQIGTAPLRWKKKQWLQFTAVGATTGVLMLSDEAIRDFFQDNRSKFLDDVSKHTLEPWGTGTLYRSYAMGFTAGMLGIGLATKDEYMTETVGILLRSMIITSASVHVIKYAAGRTRPNRPPYSSNDWNPFQGEKSFVSGHAAQVMTFATVLAERYKHIKWVPIASYSLGVLSSVSRMYDNKHWASDVFVGGLIGYIVGKSTCRFNKNRSTKWFPSISSVDGQLTYGFTYQF
ncbi:phosphatase PAP2 family protein [Prolixibacteraceae bacterium JC049]|nr:phosphatase PAP2 family protein [Prolixibacteraceae bacterium JC049]